MLTKRRPTRPAIPRPALLDAAERTRFPRAVAGEDFDRYALAMLRPAERWIAEHLLDEGSNGLGMDEVRDILQSIAAEELERTLYPQEERLLSELLHAKWPANDHPAAGRIRAEIPSFLLRQTPS